MLRRIRLKNFIHFDEEQDIVLQNGPSFCIGQNGSGKSALFEAIRRCMSTSKNMGLSASHDTSKPSIAMCYFNFNELGVESRDTEESVRNVLSCIVKFPGTCDATIKLVYIERSHTNEMYVDGIRLNENGSIMNAEITLSKAEQDDVKSLFKTDDFGLDYLLQTLENIVNLKVIHQMTGYSENTNCELNLKACIDKHVVITYPMRSIAPVQWTNSKKLSPNKRVDAEREIQERAEILAWYFDSSNDAKMHEQQVQKYFDIITDSCKVRFECSAEGELYAYEHEGTTPLGIEKIPEGYYEAINCAILLAYPGFKTICLEEPGRGMHPQMVERLRDLILRPMKDKTILVTSHKPAFVSSWNIPCMFFFKKDRTGRGPHRLKIIPGASFIDDRSEGDEPGPSPAVPGKQCEHEKTMRITTTRHFTTLYFARRVLLVEGDGDYMFLTEMKSLLLGTDFDGLLLSAMMKALGQKSGKNADENKLYMDYFQRFMWPLHIIPLNGEPNKSKLERVCKQLEIERYFVLDHDAIADDRQPGLMPQLEIEGESVLDQDAIAGDRQPNPMTTLQDSFKQFTKEFDLNYIDNTGRKVKISEENIKSDVSILENDGMFVWNKQKPLDKWKRYGTIETAIQDLHFKTGADLKDKLNDNNVTLQWDRTKKTKHRHKLFVHKTLTDQNIRNVVSAVLKHSEQAESSEVFRLVVFLFKMTLRQLRKESNQ